MGDGLKRGTFVPVPFYFAIQLPEDLVEEGNTCEDASALPKQSGFSNTIPDHEAAVVKTGTVFSEPVLC